MLTSITINDCDLSGNFHKVLLRELCDARGKFWLQGWASLDEQGGFTFSVLCLSPTIGRGMAAI